MSIGYDEKYRGLRIFTTLHAHLNMLRTFDIFYARPICSSNTPNQPRATHSHTNHVNIILQKFQIFRAICHVKLSAIYSCMCTLIIHHSTRILIPNHSCGSRRIPNVSCMLVFLTCALVCWRRSRKYDLAHMLFSSCSLALVGAQIS